MRINILTLHPAMCAPLLTESVLGRAISAGVLDVNIVDIRSFSLDKHRRADDYPFGGGAGMVLMPQPIYDACMSLTADERGRCIFMSPRGRKFTQSVARALSELPTLTLVCGHYEGIDQRAIDLCADEELSIGDFVLTGGEIAACAVADAVARLIPGVLGSDKSAHDESFSGDLLEYPQYTRPREFMGLSVPEVLLNGNHAEIDKFRREQARLITRQRRPDLL